MKNTILSSLLIFAFLCTSLDATAEEPMTPELACATMALMLITQGVNAKCAYQDVDGFGNAWLVDVQQTSIAKYEALGYILLYAENFDRSIPSKTDYILARISGSLFSAPMPETRSCLKGVGLKGLGCVVPHIKEG